MKSETDNKFYCSPFFCVQVEAGIPLPPAGSRASGHRPAHLQTLGKLRRLKVGQSFFTTEDRASVGARLSREMKAYPDIRYITREAVERSIPGIRVWRLK